MDVNWPQINSVWKLEGFQPSEGWGSGTASQLGAVGGNKCISFKRGDKLLSITVWGDMLVMGPEYS